MADSATRSPKQRPLDDETAAALTLYNTYLIADREQQAHERALKKAQKAKDEAAAVVRKMNDRKAPASKTAEAEARYREAAEALQRLRDGDTEASEDTPENDHNADDGTAASTDSSDTPAEETEDTTSDEGTPTEKTEDTTSENAEDAHEQAEDTATDDTEDAHEQAEDTASENTDEASVGVEASVGDEDLAGDEPAGVAG